MKKITLLGATLLASFALVACSQSNSTSSTGSSEKTEQASSEQKTAKKDTYKIGEEIPFENGVKITIKSAEWTDERNEFDEPQPERVLKVTYDLYNGTDKDYSIGSDLELYVDGKKADDHSIGTILETVSAGRTFENFVDAFGVNGSGKMELEVKQGFIFDNNEKKIVELDVK
ncbi:MULTISPECIES: hypothetical protein [unclassified Streptococcus]|uniref:hypothetical protein n=1 Tax=unclassified Streptococcus TaxID=2608887 RepID=UPI0018AAB952|nr:MULTISPECIES: hypothetical protein [unclassified Streptococcus]MBF8970636.1 hypothetical protein [Streptococcus sp. NLN76]MBG9367681.1 hypothetical protein [Streptococcus sp. NLN64]